jgi:hypothetical protein
MIQSACAIDRLVMLDDDHGAARVDQPVEKPEKLGDVGEMQSGCGLVQYVHGRLVGQLRRELEPLHLSADRARNRSVSAK